MGCLLFIHSLLDRQLGVPTWGLLWSSPKCLCPCFWVPSCLLGKYLQTGLLLHHFSLTRNNGIVTLSTPNSKVGELRAVVCLTTQSTILIFICGLRHTWKKKIIRCTQEQILPTPCHHPMNKLTAVHLVQMHWHSIRDNEQSRHHQSLSKWYTGIVKRHTVLCQSICSFSSCGVD